MTTPNYSLCANAVVRYLQKPAEAITCEDLMKFVAENGIRMINFIYPAEDGRLKTLNFVVNSEEYLHTILTFGERVDGSSLFPSSIEAGNSDLYVVPRYSTAFVDPFAEIPTLAMLATFFDKEGQPQAAAPDQTLRRACEAFTASTGMEFYAMGELEYYVVGETDGTYQATDQKGYRESSPYAHFNAFRCECMDLIARTGGQIKYGHAEVGNFSADGKVYEQNEIEFLPIRATEAADNLMLAKWIIRSLGAKRGLDVTFAPKITTGKAGSGLHIHFKIMKDGKNLMTENGRISDVARRVIAGVLEYAPAITAMGNKVPTSYLRLVPHQEAPTSVCWGDRNRSVLVRVPLGWNGEGDMCREANPQQGATVCESPERQTVELRSGDCSADVYQLMAAIAVGARKGMEDAEALKKAEATYVNVNIHSEEAKAQLARLQALPDSCAASADALEKVRAAFEEKDVFSARLVDGILHQLRSYNDADLRAEIAANPAIQADLVARFWHR